MAVIHRKATILPKRRFVPNSKKRQFVTSVNSSHFEKTGSFHMKKKKIKSAAFFPQIFAIYIKIGKCHP